MNTNNEFVSDFSCMLEALQKLSKVAQASGTEIAIVTTSIRRVLSTIEEHRQNSEFEKELRKLTPREELLSYGSA